MIPQEVADLADALIAEFGHHKYTRDKAINVASRMILYMRRQGWAMTKDDGA